MAWVLATEQALLRLDADGRAVAFTPARARALAGDPQRPQRVWAATADGALLGSADAGRTWRTAAALPGPGVALAVSPWDGGGYAVAGGRALMRWEAGEPPAARLEPLGLPPAAGPVLALAPAPHGPALAVALEEGVWVLEAPGAPWAGPGGLGRCRALAWPARGWLWAAGDQGAAWTADGRAWHPATAAWEGTSVGCVAVDPSDPAHPLVAATGDAGVALYGWQGGRWRRLSGRRGTGLPERFAEPVAALLAVPGEPGHLVAWLASGEAWETRDAGLEWVRFRGPLPGQRVLAAAPVV